MGKKAIIFWSGALLYCAVSWQVAWRDMLFITLGVGRKIQKIDEFPYTCKQIRSPLLESCEDLWFDEEGRRLYAACSTIANRGGWAPSSVLLNLVQILSCLRFHSLKREQSQCFQCPCSRSQRSCVGPEH